MNCSLEGLSELLDSDILYLRKRSNFKGKETDKGVGQTKWFREFVTIQGGKPDERRRVDVRDVT